MHIYTCIKDAWTHPSLCSIFAQLDDLVDVHWQWCGLRICWTLQGWCSEIYVPTHTFVHKKKVPRNFEKFFIIRVTLCRVSAVCFSSCLSPTQIIVWRLTALQANAKLQQTCKCKIFRSKSAHIMLTLDELWKSFATDTSSFEMHKNKMRLIKTCTGWHPTK